MRDREVYMKGIDASYSYEGYEIYKTADVKNDLKDRDCKKTALKEVKKVSIMSRAVTIRGITVKNRMPLSSCACRVRLSAGSRGRRQPYYFSFPYSSSDTGSSHSLEVSSPGTSTARWANQESGAAPCQCLTPAGIFTTSPGCSSCASLPHS